MNRLFQKSPAGAALSRIGWIQRAVAIVSLSLSGCAFQMKMASPPGKTIQLASPTASCRPIASDFFWFFAEQKIAMRELEKIPPGKRARLTVRQNIWEIFLNGASFGLANMGTLNVEACD